MDYKNLITIIYCSSNREHPLFEQRIREGILKNCGGLQIVSVTQKPISDFGKNICVGDDVGVSGFNFFRQSLIACLEAKTKFVLTTEADCCYPPDYFQFIPPKEDICYRNSNLYVMGDHRDYWSYKPEGATHSQIIGREFYVETLEKWFRGAPQWSPNEKNFPKERWGKEDVFGKQEIEYYRTENPVFQIKTHRSMRYFTTSDRIPRYELPYWGSGAKIRKFYMEGVPEVYAKVEN